MGGNTKVERLGIEKEVVQLRQGGLSFEEIANNINGSDLIPEGEMISGNAVRRFLEKVPDLQRELAQRDRSSVMKAFDNSFSVMNETKSLFMTARKMMEDLQAQDGFMSPKSFKAISSEMRATLELMISMQKDMAEIRNVEVFMATVIDAVQEVAPSAVPLIAEKLRQQGGTSDLFAEAIEGSVDEQ